ncbi:MAG TPA: hypothetical protein VJN71_10630 [Nitrososphaerales archaeon]|nr:hypothetical protein [Nitrososphaerales archaeon]
MTRIQVSCDPEPIVKCSRSPAHVVRPGPFHVKDFQASNEEHAMWMTIPFAEQEKIRAEFRSNGSCILCAIDLRIKPNA